VYAVIETGGRQVRVKEGGTVRVERLDGSPGDEVTLDRVLLVRQDASTEIGTPLLEGARVRARVVRQGRARKIRVMKYKAKARYRRRQGHRQAFTELRIEKIELDAKGGPGDKTEQPARPHERKARGGA
jgi:large subunit ribosomal protein L21